MRANPINYYVLNSLYINRMDILPQAVCNKFVPVRKNFNYRPIPTFRLEVSISKANAEGDESYEPEFICEIITCLSAITRFPMRKCAVKLCKKFACPVHPINFKTGGTN